MLKIFRRDLAVPYAAMRIIFRCILSSPLIGSQTKGIENSQARSKTEMLKPHKQPAPLKWTPWFVESFMLKKRDYIERSLPHLVCPLFRRQRYYLCDYLTKLGVIERGIAKRRTLRSES